MRIPTPETPDSAHTPFDPGAGRYQAIADCFSLHRSFPSGVQLSVI